MKKRMLEIAYSLNMIAFFVFPVAFVYNFYQINNNLQNSWSSFKIIMLIVVELVSIGNLILLIGNLIIWNKNDKTTRNLLLLLLLNFLYCPTYYRDAKEKNWI